MVRVRREAVLLALCCSFGLASAGGCSGDVRTVTDSDSDAAMPDAAGGSGGRGGSGAGSGTAGRGETQGSGSGGASGSVGAAGIGGSAAGMGGVAGRGGAAGVSGVSGAGAAGGAITDCFPSGGDNPCVGCVKRNCCFELAECAADNPCSGADGNGEITCIQNCVHAVATDGGVVSDASLSFCASRCAPSTTITPATNDLLACMNNGTRADGGMGTDCFVECLAGD